ncbi:unnamed protein product [Darwinula stevensoni]|uniref:SHSP domain-containing protein n=1 Tax=Darwinula stevensoni TaxID=69355 RepID=A0A7R9ADD9_9CRUS|nr:unnamed protein product [Darwinula stevensoni]CAG0901225.1 unnamed protein product [Darwinula stevensoni]
MAMFHLGLHPRRNWWDELDPVSRVFDQHFGLGLHADDLLSPTFYHPFYLRPRRPHREQARSGVSEVVNDKDMFQVSLDVQQFAPEEITVKTVGDSVVIEGKHEEKPDEHGFVSRQFLRRYLLPANVRAEDVKSSLSSDGVLTVSAAKMVCLPGVYLTVNSVNRSCKQFIEYRCRIFACGTARM